MTETEKGTVREIVDIAERLTPEAQEDMGLLVRAYAKGVKDGMAQKAGEQDDE